MIRDFLIERDFRLYSISSKSKLDPNMGEEPGTNKLGYGNIFAEKT